MSYTREVVTVAALIFPWILLYKLWYGRRSFQDLVVNNDDEYVIPLADSTSIVDASSDTSNSIDPSRSFPSTDSTPVVVDATSNSTNNPSSLFPSVEYEVFLSFRGLDTRKQFTNILYKFLRRYQIHTFIDNEELHKGKEIGSNLLRAISQSKIYVPIISKSYADSKWCLMELAEIVQRQEEDTRRIILPVFYMVNPRNVRDQTGPFEEAFQEHTNKFGEETAQSWRNAMKKVGQLKGWHVESNDEQGDTAEGVSAEVWSQLSKENFILETDKLVGIEDSIKTVEEKLSLNSKSVTMVGLYGMGGIGKTTIAKAVYNNISSRFDRCCFVENIRDTQGEKDGTVVLQKKLLAEILKIEYFGFTNDSVGRKMIKDRVSSLKILVVLDDVDEKFKFEDIYGSPKDFYSESRFIITSRNQNVLSTLIENPCKLHEVGSLGPPHSLELFCKHAFKKDSPPTDYETLANDIVSTTGGLPLTLKVIGSLLFRQESAFWYDKLEQLRESLRLDKVLDCLKTSYDALEYDAQQILLDIACFFIGTNKEMPSYMWSDCKFYPASNIIILIQRCMIKIGDKGEFQMHDQLRDMGKEIVRREDIERPWMRSRIWSTEEGIELLLNKKGSSRVKAIRLSSHSNVKYELKSEYFLNLSELRYFHARSTTLTGDFNNLLPNLRWLDLPYHEHKENDPLLTNFIMKKLVVFVLEESHITDDWGGWSHMKMAERLKVVQLCFVWGFKKLPCFPRSIEVLSMIEMEDIEELGVGELEKLKTLELTESSIRKIRGGTFGMLKELRKLSLNGFKCTNLRQVVADVGQLSSLEILKTSGAKEVEYGFPLGLKELSTSSRIPNLSELLDLEVLNVYDCKDGIDIPRATVWHKASKLKTLWLAKTKINRGSGTHDLLLLPSSLTSLEITKCESPTWLPSMENLENLTVFEMRYVNCQTPDLGGLQGLTSLRKFVIRRVNGLTRIKGLRDLFCSSTCKLEALLIHSCRDLTEIVPCELFDQTSVVLVPSLQHMLFCLCPQLEVGPIVRGLSKFPRLKSLTLMMVKIEKLELELELKEIGSLEDLVDLTLMLLLMSSLLERIASLSKLQKLRKLCVNLPGLREIQGLGELKSLQYLNLQLCTSLERLWPEDEDHKLCSLEKLYLQGCTSLNVDHLSALPPSVEIRLPHEEVELYPASWPDISFTHS